MRYVKWGFLALLAVVLLTVAFANRTPVEFKLLPEDIGAFAGLTWSIEMPLFMMVFGGIVAGLLIGFVWEWLREHKHRIEATRQGREARKLKREVDALKSEKRQARGEDDVLALLEDAR
ncbi:MAG: LapA family protein [Marinovum sp.]|nr:LapA family protein [Marinovum sp.]NQZ72212.1 LapA family protein [Dinoroseobacter sp.]